MNGKEFIWRAKKLGGANGVAVVIDKAQGNGSHQTLFFGSGTFTNTLETIARLSFVG